MVNGNSSYPLCIDHKKDDIDALGYLVPNYLIRKSLFDALRPYSNVEFINTVLDIAHRRTIAASSCLIALKE